MYFKIEIPKLLYLNAKYKIQVHYFAYLSPKNVFQILCNSRINRAASAVWNTIPDGILFSTPFYASDHYSKFSGTNWIDCNYTKHDECHDPNIPRFLTFADILHSNAVSRKHLITRNTVFASSHTSHRPKILPKFVVSWFSYPATGETDKGKGITSIVTNSTGSSGGGGGGGGGGGVTRSSKLPAIDWQGPALRWLQPCETFLQICCIN